MGVPAVAANTVVASPGKTERSVNVYESSQDSKEASNQFAIVLRFGRIILPRRTRAHSSTVIQQ